MTCCGRNCRACVIDAAIWWAFCRPWVVIADDMNRMTDCEIDSMREEEHQ